MACKLRANDFQDWVMGTRPARLALRSTTLLVRNRHVCLAAPTAEMSPPIAVCATEAAANPRRPIASTVRLNDFSRAPPVRWMPRNGLGRLCGPPMSKTPLPCYFVDSDECAGQNPGSRAFKSAA